MTKYILAIFLSTSVLTAISQPYSTQNEKAIKWYEEAKNKYILKEYAVTQKLCTLAIQKDRAFVEAYYLLAGALKATGDRQGDITTLRECANVNGPKSPQVYQLLSLELVEWGKHEEASPYIDTMLSYKHVMSAREAQQAQQLKQRNDFCKRLIANPVHYSPINLGPSVNSANNDYLPALTVDEALLVWTSLVSSGEGNNDQEDFFFSEKRDNAWTDRKNMGAPLNTPGNEGAQTVSADGRLFFFTACNRPDGLGSCDIYYSLMRGNKWTLPRDMKSPVNSRYWESQPSCSADGRMLVFASNRPGTRGEMDLWETRADNTGTWCEPKNLGDKINTPGYECSPFIHPDGKTLYFASTGHHGMGGLDLFVSRKDSTGNWGTPVNLGYPINTWRDESDLRVNARGTMAIISSNRDGGYGGSDLYQFELYPGARPQAVSYVKGVISDAKSGKKLQAAFELTDVSSGDIVVQSLSNELSGQFIVTLPPDREYALNVSKQGYLFYSEHFDLKNTRDTLAPTMLNIRLQPIEPGNTVVLKNVFFDSNSFTLKPESKVELTLLVEFMLANPTVGIELSGHTDNTGDQKKNIVLSEQRSKAVKTFMMLGGIAEKRLSCKGYGDTRPLEANDSEEHKAKNRRTEFMVVEK